MDRKLDNKVIGGCGRPAPSPTQAVMTNPTRPGNSKWQHQPRLPIPPLGTKWPSGWIAFARKELEARGGHSDNDAVLNAIKAEWRLGAMAVSDIQRHLLGLAAPGRLLTPKRPPRPLRAVRRSMRAKGERLSKQRRCALRVLRRLAPGQRLTAKGLEDALRAAGVKTSTATAYRLMHWLNKHRDRGCSQ
jgi:hypothetical protein